MDKKRILFLDTGTLALLGPQETKELEVFKFDDPAYVESAKRFWDALTRGYDEVVITTTVQHEFGARFEQTKQFFEKELSIRGNVKIMGDGGGFEGRRGAGEASIKSAVSQLDPTTPM